MTATPSEKLYTASEWDERRDGTGHRWPRSTPARAPYPKHCLRRDLAVVRAAWRKYQSVADKDGVYTYLTSVYALAAAWSRENRANSQARRALRLSKHPIRMALEPTAIIIFCTADPVKVDGRTRSRWSRLLRYAAAHNTPPKALATFIKCRGGINRCSSLLSTPENAV
jgi:hypothetical protein